jgi:hypothetical protein
VPTLDPRELYDLASDVPDLGRPVLVQALDGFIDAGGARARVRDHLLASCEARPVVTFDVDQLFDYRARRPAMLFVEDHWESYDTPSLTVHHMHDDKGTPYLMLSGPEPDVQWERFSGAVRQVVEHFGVRLTVGLNAIPMAVPHTRPGGVIAHASRPELIEGFDPWVAAVQVPASAGHLLEYRLGQAGHDAVGFAVHVPHYVSQMDFPSAAVTLLQSISAVGALVLPTAALEEAAAETRRSIDEQVAANVEVAEVVRALETQYDSFVAGRGQSLLDDGTRLPTGDELGAELERFLQEQRRPDA